MSLRRGLQIVVGAIRRRVQQQGQAQGQVHPRQKPDGAPGIPGEQSLNTRGPVAHSWSQNGVNVLHQNHSNLANNASRMWGGRLLSRVRIPQANGSSRAPPRSPILSLLLGFAGVGFVRHDESNLVSDDDGNSLEQGWGQIDLETAIQTIQSVFKFHDRVDQQLQGPGDEDDSLPRRIEAYSVSERCLAKGTEGVVYAAKKKGIVSSDEGDAALPGCHDNAITVDDAEGQQRDDRPNMELDICEEKECNLAIKMMFNYNVGSTPSDIEAEFKAEQLPLLLATGKFGRDTTVGAQKSSPRLGTSHPNIIRMYQAFVGDVRVPNVQQAMLDFDMALPRRINPLGLGADTTLYIVMKRYKSTLREYLKTRAPLTDRAAMLIVTQLLEAVAYLGSLGIVHRDLKTDNILVDCEENSQTPRVAVADFGCALSLRGKNLSESLLEEDRKNPGNCSLRASEVKQAFAQNSICYGDFLKSDAWAVGAIAYEVCGQENPFYSLRGLQSDTYNEQSLPQLQTQSVGLRAVVQLLLQRDPCKRPSAHVAADMLHLFLWQPAYGALTRLSQGQASAERELVPWLIKVSLTYLMRDQLASIDVSSSGVPGAGMSRDRVEQGLMGLFLRRVNADSLKRAARRSADALRDVIRPNSFLREARRCISDRRECATWQHQSASHPTVICHA